MIKILIIYVVFLFGNNSNTIEKIRNNYITNIDSVQYITKNYITRLGISEWILIKRDSVSSKEYFYVSINTNNKSKYKHIELLFEFNTINDKSKVVSIIIDDKPQKVNNFSYSQLLKDVYKVNK
jgi:hypothetical protein